MSRRIGLVLSRPRPEDKMILKALKGRAVSVDVIRDGDAIWNFEEGPALDLVIDRSLSYGRALTTAALA